MSLVAAFAKSQIPLDVKTDFIHENSQKRNQSNLKNPLEHAKGHGKSVCKLRSSIFGLKQANTTCIIGYQSICQMKVSAKK